MKKLILYVENEVITKKDGSNMTIKKMYVKNGELKIPVVLKNQYGELDNQLLDLLLAQIKDESN